VDLDGVLRHWPRDESDNNRVTGLDPEVVRAALFEPNLLNRAVVGTITDEEWHVEAAAQLRAVHGIECAAALLEARAYPGVVDFDVLEVLRGARQVMPVCLLTNATTRLGDHLTALGLLEEFDRVFNSSELRVAKPDPGIFERVCADLQMHPSDVVFIDDSESHVKAALTFGMRAHVFSTSRELRDALARESILS